MIKKNRGYTLIELLAVVAMLTVISSVMAGILYSTLRGSSRVRITTEVAQNGDYALSIIKGIIADSRDIIEMDGASISDCTASPRSPASGTCSDGTCTSTMTLRRISGGTTQIACRTMDGVFTVASGSASLMNTKSVKVENCAFSCAQLVDDPYSIPVVNVSFTVSDLNTGLFETRSSSDFNISTSLRTYSP